MKWCDDKMSTVVVVEIRRYHWSEKVIKKSFTIMGKSPYAETLKLCDTSQRVSLHEKGSRAWRISKCFAVTKQGRTLPMVVNNPNHSQSCGID
jgi:hypothetical protein